MLRRNVFLPISLAIICSQCSHISPSVSPNKNALLPMSVGLLGETRVDASTCTEVYGGVNVLYFLPTYGSKFRFDFKQYRTILIGDSTMDISSRYPDFMLESTQSVAVSGNTMCDMIRELAAINTVAPENIVVGGTGGNDLRRFPQISIAQIVSTADLLMKAIKAKFPQARVSMVGIHPRNEDKINQHKDQVNAGVAIEMAKNFDPSQGCFYDPLPLFGVQPGERAHDSDLIDGVHYNREMSFRIKSALGSQCSMTF